MRLLMIALTLSGILSLSGGSYAQNIPSNRSQGDACQSEAEQLYRNLRNLRATYADETRPHPQMPRCEGQTVSPGVIRRSIVRRHRVRERSADASGAFASASSARSASEGRWSNRKKLRISLVPQSGTPLRDMISARDDDRRPHEMPIWNRSKPSGAT